MQRQTGSSKVSNFDFDSLPVRSTKLIYSELTVKENAFPKLASSWSNKLQTNITVEEIDGAFSRIKQLAFSVKLQDFQFRFLHQKIFTNQILYKWKLVESERCFYCRDHYETMSHLFFDCAVVKRFWTRVWTWYKVMTDTEIIFTNKYLLLNMYTDRISILDVIVLIAKQYIFQCKCLQKELNFYNFKDQVLLHCKIEHRNTLMKGKHKPFQKRWSLFLK